MVEEYLPFKVEIWNANGSIERVVCRSALVLIGRAAFDEAVREYPSREITLRDGSRVIAEHKGQHR